MVTHRALCLRLALVVVVSVAISLQFPSQALRASLSSSGDGNPPLGFNRNLIQLPFGHPSSAGGEMPALDGEKAINYLKQEGSYDSLAEAMTAARYSVNWVSNPRMTKLGGGAYEAHNPAQGFTSYFRPEGVALMSGLEAKLPWMLEMKLKGIGYGEQLAEMSAGTPTVTNNRIELARTSFLIPHSSSLSEWYVNGPDGLEQGMTIPSAPGERTGDSLRVTFELGRTLEAQSAQGGQAIHFYDRSGEFVLSYAKLVVTDAEGQQLAAQMGLEGGEVVLEIDDSEAVYPVTIDPTFGQQSKFTASDGAAGDQFGGSVAMSGETAVVGVPRDDIGGNADQGSAYVFVRNGTTWSQQAKLMAVAPAAGAANDRFGSSVAINGETVVVGASTDTVGGNVNQGSAYVFVRSGTTWSQ